MVFGFCICAAIRHPSLHQIPKKPSGSPVRRQFGENSWKVSGNWFCNSRKVGEFRRTICNLAEMWFCNLEENQPKLGEIWRKCSYAIMEIVISQLRFCICASRASKFQTNFGRFEMHVILDGFEDRFYDCFCDGF